MMTLSRNEKRTITSLASQYFDNLQREGKNDTDDNLRAWLWFACPAERRPLVEQSIACQRVRRGEQSMFAVTSSGDVVSVRYRPNANVALRADDPIAGWFEPLFVSPNRMEAEAFQATRERKCDHDWEIVSHEEVHCERCGVYRFMPDVE